MTLHAKGECTLTPTKGLNKQRFQQVTKACTCLHSRNQLIFSVDCSAAVVLTSALCTRQLVIVESFVSLCANVFANVSVLRELIPYVNLNRLLKNVGQRFVQRSGQKKSLVALNGNSCKLTHK